MVVERITVVGRVTFVGRVEVVRLVGLPEVAGVLSVTGPCTIIEETGRYEYAHSAGLGLSPPVPLIQLLDDVPAMRSVLA